MAENIPPEDFAHVIKKEPNDFEPGVVDNYTAEPIIRSLVLKFVRDKSGNYSVIPLIKPDPFFEEDLDDLCPEGNSPVIKVEADDCTTLIKKESIEDGENTDNPSQVEVQERRASKTKRVNVINSASSYDKIIYCTKCIYANSKRKVMRHMQRVHPLQMHSCSFCSKSDFKEPISLESHILGNHMDIKGAMALITRKIYSCELCSYRSLKRGNFRRHLMTHGNKLKDSLEKQKDLHKTCNVTNESKLEMKLALKTKALMCYHCPYQTKDKGSLIKHVRLHKSSDHLPFTCTVCCRNFNEKNGLDSHIIKRHLDNQTLLESITNSVYECELCNYKDVNKNKVIRHKRARHVKKENKTKNISKRNFRKISAI